MKGLWSDTNLVVAPSLSLLTLILAILTLCGLMKVVSETWMISNCLTLLNLTNFRPSVSLSFHFVSQKHNLKDHPGVLAEFLRGRQDVLAAFSRDHLDVLMAFDLTQIYENQPSRVHSSSN